MISDADWTKYIDIINDFQAVAFQQTVTWKRTRVVRNRWQEGDNIRTEDVSIKGLIQYNIFRNWPINKTTKTGQIDEESCQLLLNYQYLVDNGWVNANGQFDFDPGLDKFVIEGLIYKPMGDAKAAQAKDKPLLVFIILQREETSTSVSPR